MSNFYARCISKFAPIALTVVFLFSCKNQPDDSVIQKNVTELMASNKNYSDVQVKVERGVVALNGSCYGDGCVAAIESDVAKMDGVKKVVNELTVSTTDLTLRTSVQSIISKYAGVHADVAAGEVVLRGSVSRHLLEPLMNELKALDARKIDNQLALTQ